MKIVFFRSADSPSTSVEAVNNIPQSVDNDSDFEVEAELPPLKEIFSEETYRKLKPKERKRQEVINGNYFMSLTEVSRTYQFLRLLNFGGFCHMNIFTGINFPSLKND